MCRSQRSISRNLVARLIVMLQDVYRSTVSTLTLGQGAALDLSDLDREAPGKVVAAGDGGQDGWRVGGHAQVHVHLG